MALRRALGSMNTQIRLAFRANEQQGEWGQGGGTPREKETTNSSKNKPHVALG